MGTFLRNFVNFCLLVMLYFGIVSAINISIINQTELDLKNPTTLIIGDSHPKKAIDTKYLSNAKNIAQSNEPYILTYWKLKKILETAQPDTIIIGFAHQNISTYNDLKFSEKPWVTEMLKRSYHIMNLDDLMELKVNYHALFKILFKQIALQPRKNHTFFMSKFSNNNHIDVSDAHLVLSTHYFFKEKALTVSNHSIEYLNKILEICRKNNIFPILVTTPVHSTYFNKIPHVIKERFIKEKKKLEENGFMVIDKSTDESYLDKFYLNTDHLNLNGAEKFTKDLKEQLRKHR